ncbi:MAG: DUF362 domain-containing protein [bacterium]
MKDISRRDFLKYLGIGAAGLVAGPKLALAQRGSRLLPATDSSRVVECVNDNATNGSTINEPVVQSMMDESIKALTDIADVGEAWKSIFPGITGDSVIGIKVNCINRYLATHPQFVSTIVSGLARMQFSKGPFKRNNIIVWDRTDSELTSSGYTIYTGTDPDTTRYVGTNHSGFGYDTGITFNVNGSSQNPSKILSQMCDYIIDAAVLKTHSQGVITLSMKCHYGSVHNPGGLQHSAGCSPAIPSLNQQIRDLVTPNNIQKLFIIDGLFGLYSGGPGGSPNFNPKLLIMSRDIVACDFRGQQVINIERQARSLSQLNAAQITVAAQPPYSLGTTDIELVRLVNVGVNEPGRREAGGTGLDVRPQPLRGRGTVSFALPRDGHVRVDLFDESGRVAARVFDGALRRGSHRLQFGNHGLRAGNYVLRLEGAGQKVQRAVTVVR